VLAAERRRAVSDETTTRFTTGDVDRLEVRAVQSGRHAEAAWQLQGMARRVDRSSQVPRVELLVRAGEQWEMAGDAHRALQSYRAAQADPAQAVLDPRALQIGPLLELQREAEAQYLLKALRTEGPRNLPTFITIVETLYAHGRLDAARQWATLGVVRFRDQDVSPYIHGLLTGLLRTRFRIGVDLGLAEDDLDRILED
jgi:hypothetical protein